MRFVNKSEVQSRLEGKRIAVVGSGPGVLGNAPGFVDGHDIVVRVNNYKLSETAGFRCDVHYSFYGTSIKKTAHELKRDSVMLCLCKCPDAQPIESEWHRKNGKMAGVDFRYIYQARREFWFCETFVPSVEEFRETFDLLGGHVPSTGFAAIFKVLSCSPRTIYLTGLDFFASGIHNVDEPHKVKNTDDPIGHVPERERAWLAQNMDRYPITCDAALDDILRVRPAA